VLERIFSLCYLPDQYIGHFSVAELAIHFVQLYVLLCKKQGVA